MNSSLTMTGVAKPHAPRHSTSITVNGRPATCAELAASGLLEQRLHHLLGAARAARRRRAHLDEVAAHRMLVVHRVERDHALHVRRRELEQLRDLDHRLLAHPAALALHHPERGQQRRHLGRVARRAASSSSSLHARRRTRARTGSRRCASPTRHAIACAVGACRPLHRR